MGGNEKEAQTIDFNKARLVSTYKDLNRLVLDHNDAISRLTRRLQTSLDPVRVITVFAEELAQLIKFDQTRFEHPDCPTIKIGERAGTHHCEYNLALENDYLGQLRFSRRARFAEEELAIIERLASTLVFPLRNALMYQQALRSALQDELTGFGNRRALDAALHREAELATRGRKPLSILMLDVDHFKRINDTWGHLHGDLVLKEVATTIRDSARQSDLCFRYGGEEFMLILQDSTPAQAMFAAERIRRAMAERPIKLNNTLVPVTISSGSATFRPGETLHALKDRADAALYQAKQSGRNCCISDQIETTTQTVAGV
jgi:diguanylate cyclase (GGDEF)-like protein